MEAPAMEPAPEPAPVTNYDKWNNIGDEEQGPPPSPVDHAGALPAMRVSERDDGGISFDFTTMQPDANEFEDGVQAASLGSQLAFTLAVVLLVIITGGTLYVSAREAMDRKEESDAREEMERQERIVEANKGKLNQAANKRRKPKVSNLDKLVAEGIIEPGSANAASKKKLNRTITPKSWIFL